MKNLLFCVALLFLSVAVTAQSSAIGTAEETTDLLAEKYQLNQTQKAELLEIQERKYRNLAEIEEFKSTEPELYIRKVRALQYANDKAMEELLNETQLAAFRQQKMDLRKQKAEIYKEMKSNGASQNEIDWKICELEKQALISG